MAVVINEFEVVPGQSDAGQRELTSSASDAGEKTPPAPREIERVFEQQLERGERVWAH